VSQQGTGSDGDDHCDEGGNYELPVRANRRWDPLVGLEKGEQVMGHGYLTSSQTGRKGQRMIARFATEFTNYLSPSLPPFPIAPPLIPETALYPNATHCPPQQ